MQPKPISFSVTETNALLKILEIAPFQGVQSARILVSIDDKLKESITFDEPEEEETVISKRIKK